MRRVAVSVPPAQAERARALMIGLFPEGFEERDTSDGLELAAYTDYGGEERLWAVFGMAHAANVEPGWEDRWRAFHRPVRVGPLWVGPPWEEPPADATVVVIDPGRAFGTGSHPTTRLCLELLLGERPGSVLDVGCGSGVLAIAAAKLGFAPVVAIDVDPQAVEATLRNAAANNVRVEARLLDLVDGVPTAELAIANIAPGPVRSLVLQEETRRVITSGYLVSEEPVLPGFTQFRRLQRDGWAADLHERQ